MPDISDVVLLPLDARLHVSTEGGADSAAFAFDAPNPGAYTGFVELAQRTESVLLIRFQLQVGSQPSGGIDGR